MKKLHKILTDLEQGKISSDHAEQQVLDLFAVSVSWLSPIESERQWQEQGIKKIWAGYPNCSFRWQYLNGLIRMTCEYLKIDVDKP